ncbi:myosin-9 [Ictalurus punctatus]|uniref:Myosin-9 n=1 Tax=Ictalurus punctatus TaxID=7998 RepID=A0A9F7TKV4_ICTPU|nr:myosin-9 [Ictalurus punctatus]
MSDGFLLFYLDPVCDQATEPALLQPTEVPQDQLTNAVTEAEEKNQKLVVSNTQLEERVRELEELLCEARRDDMKSKVSLAEAEEKHQMAVETIAQLKVEKSDLKDQVKKLRGTVQDMENLLHAAEVEKSDLKDQAKTLQGRVRYTENLLHFVEVEKSGLTTKVESLQRRVKTMVKDVCDTDWELGTCVHEVQVNNDEIKKHLIDAEEILKVNFTSHEITTAVVFCISLSEAEEKHQTAVEIIAQLEVEKSGLKDQVESLQRTVENIGNLLHLVEVEKSDLKNQVETLQRTVQDMGNLLHVVDVEKPGLKEQVELLQGTIQNMGDLLHAVEVEKSDLKVQVKTLQGRVENMQNQPHPVEKEKSVLNDQVKTLQGRLRLMWNMLNETYKWAIGVMNEVQVKDDEMKKHLIHAEEILKVTLPEAEEEHQKDVETIAQLKVEKSDLKDQMKTLQGRVRYTENLLHFVEVEKSGLITQVESLQRRVKTVVKDVCDTDWELGTCVHEVQVKNNEIKKHLIHAEEILKVSMAEAEEKHQTALETIAQLEVEKSGLTTQMESLQRTVQTIVELVCDTDWAFGTCIHEVQVKNDEMKKLLIDSEELLKVSLSEAEEKHQKAVETIAQLAMEKSGLTTQVESLQGRVRYTENLLDFVQKEKSDLTTKLMALRRRVKAVVKHVFDTDWELGTCVHEVQVKNDEMKKHLIHAEEILKVSMAEAEEKHQTVLETIAQLEVEKSGLTTQMESLQRTVQTLVELVCDTDWAFGTCIHEVQVKNDEMKKHLIDAEEILKP